MKNKIFLTLFVLLALVNTKVVTVNAATNLTIEYTDYVDNVKYPATTQTSVLEGLRTSSSFTLETPTVVKIFVNWDSSKVQTGTLWYSKDSTGIDLVSNKTPLSSTNHFKEIFLDPGTYYVNYVIGTEITDYSKASTVSVGVSAIGQKIVTTEDYIASSYTNPNTAVFNKKEIGFLSETSPIDYYKFTLKEESTVHIKYNFSSYTDVPLTSPMCTLLDSNKQLITTQSYSTYSESNEIVKTLKAGTYYVYMSGATTDTSLLLSKTSRVIKTKLSKSGSYNVVKISVPYDYTAIMVYKGKVAKSNILNYTYWSTTNTNCRELLGTTSFKTKKKGTYTIRVYASDGTYSMVYVKVK